MLGRTVTTGSNLLRLPLRARRVILRVAPFQCQSTNSLLSRTVILSSQRSYASTPGRPRSTVGEPSRTVKRAVKRAARTTDGGEAAQQNATRKKAARPKKATTKAKAKAKPKPKVRKALTPEQQARKETRLAKEKIKALKKTALSPPSGSGYSAWQAFLKEKLSGSKDLGGPGHGQKLGAVVTNVTQEWKNISPAEHEHYNHLATQHRQAAAAEYKRWVESHTPEQIREANNARNQLKRLLPNAKGKKQVRGRKRYAPIKDERAVKRPVTAFMQFSINRNASGDFRNITVPERAKLISQEWKALNEGEKKKYKDLHSQELSRYTSEYTSVFGHQPPQAASATA